MGKKKYLNRFAVFFFSFMLFFTLFSPSLHRQTMPNVIVLRAKEKEFPVTVYLEDGTEYVSKKRELAIPACALNFTGDFAGEFRMGSVFVLEENEGEFFVRERQVLLCGEAEGWFEIESGVEKKDKLVYAADRKLIDGMEVRVYGN